MNKMDGMSMDLTAENIAQMKQLFPEAVTEGKIDFEVLKALLGGEIEKRQEYYKFTLNGADKIIFTNWSLIGRQFKREEYRFSEMQQENADADSLFASPQKSDTGKPVFIPSPVRTRPLVQCLKLAEEGAES